MSPAARGLVWHGVLLFLLGLVNGLAVPWFVNPRMALAAHVDAVTSGTFLMAVGLAWSAARFRPAAETPARILVLVGMYAIWVALVLAAALGTSRMTPIAGAGHHGTAAAEALVDAVLVAGSVALITGCALLLDAFRERA